MRHVDPATLQFSENYRPVNQLALDRRRAHENGMALAYAMGDHASLGAEASPLARLAPEMKEMIMHEAGLRAPA
jgi:hypothetical protein